MSSQVPYAPPETQPPPPPGTGHQPPPGKHAPGFQPPPPAPRGPIAAKAVIASLVVVLIVIAGAAAVILLRGESYSISVPLPPGFEEADARTFEEAEKSIRTGGADAKLDYLFVSESTTSLIFVAHQTFYLAETPPDDPEGAARYYSEHRDEILDQMNLGFEMGGGAYGGIDISKYDTMRLNSGDTALHMGISISVQQMSMKADLLMVVKGKTLFMVMVQGFGDENLRQTVDFLAQNITFDK